MRHREHIRVELIDGFERDGHYGALVAHRLDGFRNLYEFGVEYAGYIAIRKILAFRPFDALPGVPYRYFMGGMAGETSLGFYVMQGNVGKSFMFEVPRSLKANLYWFDQLGNLSEAAAFLVATRNPADEHSGIPPQLTAPHREPQASDPEIVSKIKSLIESELNGDYSFVNAHGVDLRRSLVEPYPEVFDTPGPYDRIVDLYIVLKEDPDEDRGKQIVFDPRTDRFGLSETIRGQARRLYWGPKGEGRFLEMLKGM